MISLFEFIVFLEPWLLLDVLELIVAFFVM